MQRPWITEDGEKTTEEIIDETIEKMVARVRDEVIPTCNATGCTFIDCDIVGPDGTILGHFDGDGNFTEAEAKAGSWRDRPPLL